MSGPLRCLSLTQPYATLVAIGQKRIETRSWRTHCRGWLAIHAAQGFPGPCQMLCHPTRPGAVVNPFWHALKAAGYEGAASLPRGAIVALVSLRACVPTTGDGINSAGLTIPEGFPLDEPERSFGDYSCGRWGWVLRDVRRLPEPIPCKGALGLWPVPADVEAAIKEQLG